MIEPAGHVKIVDRVYSRSHRYAAVLLYGYAPGHVVLMVKNGTKIVSSTTIMVVQEAIRRREAMDYPAGGSPT